MVLQAVVGSASEGPAAMGPAAMAGQMKMGSPVVEGVGDGLGSPAVEGVGHGLGSPAVEGVGHVLGSPAVEGVGHGLGSPVVEGAGHGLCNTEELHHIEELEQHSQDEMAHGQEHAESMDVVLVALYCYHNKQELQVMVCSEE